MNPYTHIQLREIFHLLFLEQLFKISNPSLYIVKGGVSLRFFFHSPRYSEDMDIDVLAGSVATLKKNGYKVLESSSLRRALQTYGIADILLNDPTKAKQTETTQRFRLRLLTEAGESLPTKVEFSRRQKGKLPFLLGKIDPQFARIYQRLAFGCHHYSGEAMVVQKVKALADRKQTQARDVFDLGVLHLGGYADLDYKKGWLTPQEVDRAERNLDALRFEDFKGQVLEYLNEESRHLYNGQKAWNELKNRVLGILSNAR